MAVATTLSQLEEVQTAISAVLEAQSVGLGDKSLLRARLAALEAREEKLLKRYREEQAAGSAGGFTNKIQFTDVT